MATEEDTSDNKRKKQRSAPSGSRVGTLVPSSTSAFTITPAALAAAAAAAASAAEASKKRQNAKKSEISKSKSKRSKPSHPPIATMVTEAIGSLRERTGSSLVAIKRYIASTIMIGTSGTEEVERLTPFIKRYIRSAVEKGALIQTSGKGVSGSFKLNKSVKKKKIAEKKPKVQKPKGKQAKSTKTKTSKKSKKMIKITPKKIGVKKSGAKTSKSKTTSKDRSSRKQKFETKRISPKQTAKKPKPIKKKVEKEKKTKKMAKKVKGSSGEAKTKIPTMAAFTVISKEKIPGKSKSSITPRATLAATAAVLAGKKKSGVITIKPAINKTAQSSTQKPSTKIATSVSKSKVPKKSALTRSEKLPKTKSNLSGKSAKQQQKKKVEPKKKIPAAKKQTQKPAAKKSKTPKAMVKKPAKKTIKTSSRSKK